MKILVFADSHRFVQPMVDAVTAELPDQIIHLGDVEPDAEELRRLFPRVPVASVPGNCDFGSTSDVTLQFTLAGKRFFITHGHRYGVKTGLAGLVNTGLTARADAILFGHTHEAFSTWLDGALIANPGAVGYGARAYGVITIENGEMTYEAKRA